MTITFLITTYNRQKSCQRLVDSLQGLGDIVVVSDGCDYNITGCTQYKQRIHRGKAGYWKTVNGLFRSRVQADYYIMLPDDFMPAKDMVTKAIEIWEKIDDESKICLNLYADRFGQACWTGIKPIDLGYVYQTGWVDMCFLCTEELFQVVPEVREVNIRWDKYPWMGSGVGRNLSIDLCVKNRLMYQVKESFVIPMTEHSISKMREK